MTGTDGPLRGIDGSTQPSMSAFGSRWPRPPLPRWATPLLALTMSVAGLVGLTFTFAGPRTYEDIARANGFERIPFLVPASVAVERRQAVRYDIATRASLHEQTLRSLVGGPIGPGGAPASTPRDPMTRDPLFSPDERRHLDDVRGVFAAARAAAIVAAVVSVILIVAAALRGSTVLARVIRDAAGLAALVVIVIGIVAAVAFEPAFLAFHYVFFPQGNFLFDPATSNLLALYPDAYWYGVTLRIAVSFIAVASLVAVVLTIRLHAAR